MAHRLLRPSSIFYFWSRPASCFSNLYRKVSRLQTRCLAFIQQFPCLLRRYKLSLPIRDFSPAAPLIFGSSVFLIIYPVTAQVPFLCRYLSFEQELRSLFVTAPSRPSS